MKPSEFRLSESGEGPAVLMLPGSYATPAAWKGLHGSLSIPIRALSTSLPGYGATPEIRPDNDANIAHLVEFVGQVVDAAGEPVHVVGHSWGAHLLLSAALAQRISPLSIVCFEANPVFAQPVEGPFPWRPDVEAMVTRFEAALACEDPEAASIIIDFYSRPGTFLGMPENFRAFCRDTAPTNLRDWHSAASFTPSFKAFASFDIPVTLVRGSETPEPVRDVTEQLLKYIPGACEKVVDGAGHFLVSTHPVACAEILETHMGAFNH
ncbi:Pimeloyl-ACP methyl ester carboxylesterase [Shimia gijangensis]|uniref:Pimeloyl-ACP methyl ester carboxylesterase n=1 Tax=Shimia gijangensis TaxID=1470563 RepID=A0A1M6SAE6_9RHOB|nr:alpha/beta hydrolase [Shimia gijangensis]SHK41753.1 Pimeloyl-ACP methyl ester carboxylesterase [Shimia gijangensis]